MIFSKKIIIISVVFAVIILILAGLVIFPLLRSIKKSSEQLVGVKEELAFSRERFANFEEMKRDYDKYKLELEKINKIFVDPNIPIDLIKFWEKIAIESNVVVDISPVSLKITSRDDVWNSIAFQMSTAGFSADVMKFIEKIESGPYLIEIKSLSLKNLSEEKSGKYKDLFPNGVRGSLSIKVFAK